MSLALGTWPRALALATLILGGVLAGQGTAAADSSPGDSAVAQYVEMIPTATGSVAAGSAGKAKATHSKAAEEKLTRVSPSVAQQLDSVATSPAYGAPVETQPSSSSVKQATQKAPTRPIRANPARPDPPLEWWRGTARDL